jgi:hypothetical protein
VSTISARSRTRPAAQRRDGIDLAGGEEATEGFRALAHVGCGIAHARETDGADVGGLQAGLGQALGHRLGRKAIAVGLDPRRALQRDRGDAAVVVIERRAGIVGLVETEDDHGAALFRLARPSVITRSPFALQRTVTEWGRDH